mgnify:CR=1 FL=1
MAYKQYTMKKNDFCVFLDAGHGGIHPTTGEYTTSPSKRYKHKHHEFHGGGWFYEGVSNRAITYKVSELLNNNDFNNVIVSHPYQDSFLSDRTKLANRLSKNFKSSIYISNHSNAANTKARGFEVFTSPGVTKSDKLAKVYWDEFSIEFADEIQDNVILMREGDDKKHHDKEARFTVLLTTAMPAMLTEHLFFDNLDDALLLIDDDFQNRIAKAQYNAIVKYFDSII